MSYSDESYNQLSRTCTKQIEQLKEKLAEQDALLRRVSQAPNPVATVLRVDKEGVLLASSLGTLFANSPDFKLVQGDSVLLSMTTSQILKKLPSLYAGELFPVSTVHTKDTVEVATAGGSKAVSVSPALSDKIKTGDQVLLDSTGSVVTFVVPAPTIQAAPEHTDTVLWDDIGGCEEAKEQLIEAVEFPLLHKKLYAHYNKKPVKGVLLYGPPGCGKTMIAKAVVTSIRKQHKATPGAFLYIKGPEILSQYVSVAEERIRTLFTQARAHREEHNFPAVIFIDEADAILGKRGSGISSDIEKTIVPAFLAEMDGLEESGAIVLLATNRPDTLDPAVVREGRIDRKVYIPRPNREAAKAILAIHMKSVPVWENKETLISFVAEHLFSAKCRLFTLHTKQGPPLHFTLGHVISGSMLAGIIDQASSLALRRDIENGEKTGITAADILQVIYKLVITYQALDHEEDLFQFAKGHIITEIEPCSKR